MTKKKKERKIIWSPLEDDKEPNSFLLKESRLYLAFPIYTEIL